MYFNLLDINLALETGSGGELQTSSAAACLGKTIRRQGFLIEEIVVPSEEPQSMSEGRP